MARKRADARTKAGRAAMSTATRHQLFIEAYLANGQNATVAATAAGYSPRSAKVTGSALLQRPDIKATLAARARHAAEAAELTTETWLRALRSILFADPADMLDADGNLLPVAAMPARARLALSAFEVTTSEAGERTAKVRYCDRNAALVTAARHLGLFERDNRQSTPPIRVVVELV